MIRVALALSLLLAGCTVDPESSPHRCSSDADCSTGRCHRPDPDAPGLCIGGAGMDAGEVDAGSVDAGCDPSSPMSCGGCGIACEDPTPNCVDGEGGYMCVSSCAPMTDCSGSCADLTNDRSNCGACGNTCDSSETCSDRRCLCGGVECGAEETCCAGACVDTSEDDDNCGECGDGCPGLATCRAGECNCGGVDDCRGTCLAGVCS